MTQIYEYKILTAQTTKQMQEKVAEAIFRGWQPLGGISYRPSVLPGNKRPIFIQAMVTYNDPNATGLGW